MQHETRELKKNYFGDDDRAYQRRVPKYIPKLGAGDASVAAPATQGSFCSEN